MDDRIPFEENEIDKTILERFEKVVDLVGTRIAAKDSTETITYQKLNLAANHLANQIHSLYGNKLEPVAIFAQPGIELLITVLAVLKSGKIYAVQDLAAPDQRLKVVISSLSPGLLIADRANFDRAVAFIPPGIELLNLSEHRKEQSGKSPIFKLDTDSPAGIFYTSGTTGEPKGVSRSHRQILHYAWINATDYPITPADRHSIITPMAFASATSDIFETLLNGASLHFFSPRKHSLDQLIDWMRTERITILRLPISLLRQLLDHHDKRMDFPDLRLVIQGGQAVVKSDLENFRLRFPINCTLVNRYTSTEAGLASMILLDHDTPIEGENVPVGYPVHGMEILIWDEFGQPVQVGQSGEIVLRSRYLTPGYWQNPALTSHVFAVDPSDPSLRLFHTGDMGRFSPEGMLEHLGRLDYMVKVRGFRVELQAIEAALIRLEYIQQAVVISRDLPDLETQVIAYLVPINWPAPLVDQLHQDLSKSLPDYMIPHLFVFLKDFPLTSSGKPDRSLLPDPGSIRPALSVAFEPPTNQIEARLAVFWSNILHLQSVGIDDPFFELGGDSLQFTRLLSQIQDLFSVSLPFQQTLRNATIRKMAEQIQASHSLERNEAPKSLHQSSKIPRHRSDRSMAMPLSFSQQRHWILHQLDPNVPVYNMPRAYRLDGPLNLEALHRALEGVVERHHILRTQYRLEADQPAQILPEAWYLELPLVDLSHLTAKAQEAELTSLLQARIEQPFDLSHDLMLRLELFRLDPETHILLTVAHHIATDQWSRSVFNRELSELYRDFSTGAAKNVLELPLQYVDYAIWQRDQFQAGAYQRQLSYWKDRMTPLPPFLDLPTDFPRPLRPSYSGGMCRRQLDSQLVESLRQLAFQERATLFMLFLAALQVWLYRLTNETDIAVGVPIGGRNRVELEGLIGCFINTLVLRCDLSHTPTFVELLGKVRQATIEAFDNPDLPFEKLIEALNPDRILDRSPLFQVMLDFINTPSDVLELQGLQVSQIDIDTYTAAFDLTLYVRPRNGSLSLAVEYNCDLFQPHTIERFLTQFETLLQAVVENPFAPIDLLPLLAATERNQLLETWNSTSREILPSVPIDQLIERQSALQPESVALIYPDGTMTYADLDHRANQLARFLRQSGLRRGDRVGIWLERSSEMVVALLSVLKAGGVLLPLDPRMPLERLLFILQDAQAAFLLTRDEMAHKLPNLSTPLISLDMKSAEIASCSPDTLTSWIGLSDPVYVLYTSGSTGTPKGVLIPHRALLNHSLWVIETFGYSRSTVGIQYTSLSFDVSIGEIFDPLISGGKLVIPHPDRYLDPDYLLELMKSVGVTTIDTVPPLLYMLLENKKFDLISTLEQIHCGGEAMPDDLPVLVHQRMEHTRLYNLYGPTETTVDSFFHLCKPDHEQPPIPIGRPISNTRVYILDSNLQPVPVGLAGELFIGGAGLAYGYLNRPKLTAETFLPDPFTSIPGERMYRTGDRARYRSDGTVEFLGRFDRQIKLRGMRVELGEIESVLLRHPRIERAIVEPAQTDQEGSSGYLVAYLLAEDGQISPDELKNYLKTKLPEYMLPADYVFLDAIPLLPSGKVDLQALRALGTDRPRPAVSRRAYTALEKVIVQIWEEVLGIHTVGVDEDFFFLGGHSLLAIRSAALLNDLFHLELPLRQIFETRTVSALAQFMRQRAAEAEQLEEAARLLLDLVETPDSSL
jgi:amino acid adenylation domain-containing protein